MHTRMVYKPHIHGVVVFFLCVVLAACSEARDSGYGQLRIDAAGTEIKVFTYRSPTCANPSLLFVFHGLNRKAEGVRDSAVDVADRACLMVFAPLFDKERFPNWRYHRAGVFRKGRVQPPSRWTAATMHALLDEAKKIAKRPDAKMYLFGHSAGGQFLSRIAAYAPPPDVQRIVIANPSVYVAPLVDEAAPNGFGGVFSSRQTRRQLETYLALPITIYLGQQDTGDKSLVRHAAAMRQGATRLERGRNVYCLARDVAQQKGWTFNWRLVEAVGVGHSSRRMLRAPALQRALGLSEAGDVAEPGGICSDNSLAATDG